MRRSKAGAIHEGCCCSKLLFGLWAAGKLRRMMGVTLVKRLRGVERSPPRKQIPHMGYANIRAGRREIQV
jgi:hypothetical protein